MAEPAGGGLPILNGTEASPTPTPHYTQISNYYSYCLPFTKNRPSSYCLLKAEKCVSELILLIKSGMMEDYLRKSWFGEK